VLGEHQAARLDQADVFLDAGETSRRFHIVIGLERSFEFGAAEAEVELVGSRNWMLFEPGNVGFAPCSILGLALDANEQQMTNKTSALPHICPTNFVENKKDFRRGVAQSP
jgi:hypothetical protein